MAKNKDLVTLEEPSMNDLIPFDQVPEHLKNQTTVGLEALGKDDFKIPRIKLLQPLNPEVTTYQGKAIPGEFWHTSANKSLGSEFRFVPCVASKRVVLFAPRNSDHEGMLAFSRDGINWDMGEKKRFEIKVKKVPNPLIWETGRNVKDSGLLEWGSYNSEDDESGPAAQLSYEYLCYLPDHPNLSPVVLGTFRTAIGNAKNFNTSLIALRKPIQSVMVRCFSDMHTKGTDAWWVPAFELKGWATKELYDIAQNIYEKQKDYKVEYSEDEVSATPTPETAF